MESKNQKKSEETHKSKTHKMHKDVSINIYQNKVSVSVNIL